MNLPSSVLQEFRASAIPDALTLANVGWAEGEDAIALLIENAIARHQYATKAVQKLQRRYDFARHGGWYAIAAEGAYFKPIKPRIAAEGFGGKAKPIKYESAPGCPASPIFPLWGELHPQHEAICITEGLKKALALMGQGYSSIACRGITMWNSPGTGELHPSIAAAIAPGQTVILAFDQDEKLKTRIAVYRQLCKLAKAIAKVGGIPKILHWDRATGKGIDDALARVEDPSQWLAARVEAAMTLKEYQVAAAREAAIAHLSRASSILHNRITEGDYLPSIPYPQQGTITTVEAPVGAGKTQAIAAVVERNREQGLLTLVVTPLNALGKQTAARFALPHIHDYPPNQREHLLNEVRAYGGLVLCPDSLPRVGGWFERDFALILDEANQVVDHLTGGATLGDRLPVVAAEFKRLAEAAEWVLASEDGIPDHAIHFLRSISRKVVGDRILHRRKNAQWKIHAYDHRNDWRSALLERLDSASDRPLLLVTSSKTAGKVLEQLCHDFFPDLRVTRIDSETNEQGRFDAFFNAPDQWLKEQRPQVLILSPSAKSGVSIEGGVKAGDAYFADVWGYFPCLSTDAHLQLLGRYRPNVPRHIFVPPILQSDFAEGLGWRSKEIASYLRRYAIDAAQSLGIEILADEQRDLRLETAILEYRAAEGLRSGTQKAIARESLKQRLEGHQWQQGDRASKDERRSAGELFKRGLEAVWNRDGAEAAALSIEQRHSPQWAMDTLGAIDAPHVERLRAEKVLLRARFPGIDFDAAEEWVEGCFRDGGIGSKAALEILSRNPAIARDGDKKDAEKLLSAPIIAYHRMPRRSPKAALLRRIGLTDFVDRAETYTNTSPAAIALKEKALGLAKELHRYFRIVVKETQTPVAIANKLLKKWGRQAIAVKQSHCRDTGERIRHYAIAPLSELHERFLKAAEAKASGTGNTICSRGSEAIPPPNTNHVPTPSSPIDWFSSEGQALLRHDLSNGLTPFWAPAAAVELAKGGAIAA